MNSFEAGLLACSTDDAFPPGGSGTYVIGF
ncbi:hypothetical protein FH603_2106 [Spirosoma sp. LMG 31447]|uniref:Uncharacterized protein n=1 Tax=Spirosoma utsteinense TaxID=2585773 RepID=A0ABR6W4T7_9BACT|nr:hypothetical protein [Spirosoma utsteinense]